MSHLFNILMSIMMIAVLVALFLGLLSMARGGTSNKKYANRLMRARVVFQAIALVFFVIGLLIYKRN